MVRAFAAYGQQATFVSKHGDRQGKDLCCRSPEAISGDSEDYFYPACGSLKAIVGGDSPLAESTIRRQLSQVKYVPADDDCRVRAARQLIDDRYLGGPNYFASHASGASRNIPGCNRRGVVVAGHTDQLGARTDRSECQTAMHILRAFPQQPNVRVADTSAAGPDRGRSRPACQNNQLYPYLCD